MEKIANLLRWIPKNLNGKKEIQVYRVPILIKSLLLSKSPLLYPHNTMQHMKTSPLRWGHNDDINQHANAINQKNNVNLDLHEN
jgi:hypothetical protein